MKLRPLFTLLFALFLINCTVQRGQHEYMMNYEIPANAILTIGNSSNEVYKITLRNISNNQVRYSFNNGTSGSLMPGDSAIIDANLKKKIDFSTEADNTSTIKLVILNNKYKLRSSLSKK